MITWNLSPRMGTTGPGRKRRAGIDRGDPRISVTIEGAAVWFLGIKDVPRLAGGRADPRAGRERPCALHGRGRGRVSMTIGMRRAAAHFPCTVRLKRFFQGLDANRVDPLPKRR